MQPQQQCQIIGLHRKDMDFMRKTKIVCTIGPVSQTEEKLKELLLAGMNVARFNFSHGTHEEHKKKFDRLCSGLNILVSRHLIILKSLSFPSSRKSGSIGQLHNQFADIGLSQRNIVKNNSFDFRSQCLTKIFSF